MPLVIVLVDGMTKINCESCEASSRLSPGASRRLSDVWLTTVGRCGRCLWNGGGEELWWVFVGAVSRPQEAARLNATQNPKANLFELYDCTPQCHSFSWKQWSREVSTRQKPAAATRQHGQHHRDDAAGEELNGNILRAVEWSCISVTKVCIL